MLCAVLFDAVGTLIYPHPPVAEAYAAAGRRCGSQRTEAEILGRFRGAFAAQEAVDVQRGQATNARRERARWRAIVASVFDDVADSAPIFKQLWRHFAQTASWRLYDDVADGWRALSAQGAALGIASNFDHRLLQICGGLPPLDACQRIFVSSRVGRKKPHSEFFRHIERSLALAPSELLLVGDDLDCDYEAALNAGWQAVLLHREAGRDAGPHVLRSLAELPRGLETL